MTSRRNARGRHRSASAFAALNDPTVAAGFNDVLDGRPFRTDYDSLDTRRQLLYELGRAMSVIFMRLRHGHAPVPSGRDGEYYRRQLMDLPAGRSRSNPVSTFNRLATEESRVGVAE